MQVVSERQEAYESCFIFYPYGSTEMIFIKKNQLY